VYTRSGGKVTSRNIDTTGESSQACVDTEILDVSGIGLTGTDGKVEFLLSDFHCEGRALKIQAPLNFLCTPLSTSLSTVPAFLTTSRTVILTNVGADVKLTVFSWDPTGAPAPTTFFDWRCRIAVAALV
jgi:hypothetical protein